MTLSPPSRLDMTNGQQGDLIDPAFVVAAADDEATMPSPLSKFARRPDLDEESAAPPPVNKRDSREEETLIVVPSEHPSDENNTPGQDALRTPTISTDAESQDSVSSNQETVTSNNSSENQVPSVHVEDEDPEAESIALARMLMEQEAIESYGALSADYLRYNANQFSQEDLAALQAAMAEDEGSDDGGGEQPFSYDVMLRLGESIGDVKKERWNMIAQSQIDKLETFTFDAKAVQGKDDNDCDVKCLVCQFPYESDDSLRRLPCGHAFHSECVAQWLKDNDVCPYCRQTIVKE